MSRPRPPSQQPTVMMPAARDSIEVVFDDDTDPHGELPTDPLPPPESATLRPPSGELEELRRLSLTGEDWREEPVFAYDRDARRLVLCRPYVAVQTDQHGNMFVVECVAGLRVQALAHPQAWRLAIVTAQIDAHPHALVFPFSGGGLLRIPRVDDQWRRAILKAFQDGDMGARERTVLGVNVPRSVLEDG